jgi:hypothetical protein
LLLRQSKIENLDLPFAPQGLDYKQVRWLDIPMDDALEVRRGQGRRSLLGKGHHFIRREAFSLSLGEIMLECLARNSSITR